MALVADDLARVNAEILARMQSEVPLIPRIARHIIEGGGKRIRPMLTLAAANMCGYQGTDHALLAACVEFIHTATLLHDDVIDESGQRRGKPTANAVFGNQAAVLVGDFLFARAFQLMVTPGSLEILRILSNASAVICEGEVLQLTTVGNVDTSEETYLRVIEAKTAALFGAACRVGALLAGHDGEDADALEAYGHHLGIAFQLVDDALDYSPADAKLGKDVGDDFKEGKLTLPVILAHLAGDETERGFWQRTVGRREQTDSDLIEAQRLMQRHGTIAATLARAEREGQRAIAALTRFPASELRRALEAVVLFCVQRRY